MICLHSTSPIPHPGGIGCRCCCRCGGGVVRNLDRETSNGGTGLMYWNYSYVNNGNGNVGESNGNESGYGSELGYRGDAKLGYGDEFDEEEDDARLLFWGNRFGGIHCLITMLMSL